MNYYKCPSTLHRPVTITLLIQWNKISSADEDETPGKIN